METEPKSDGLKANGLQRDGRGGPRAGAGRKYGSLASKNLTFIELCRLHTPKAVERLVQLMMQDEDRRLAFDAACILIAHAHGKPRESVVHEQQDILTVQYQSVEDARRAVEAEGFPLTRLEAPRLIKHD
jgi:hypothetical protein